MNISMSKLNEPRFFPWPEGDGGINIRALNKTAIDEINAATVTREQKFRSGVPYERTKVDTARADEMAWDYIITGWTGLNDTDNGKEIKCTAENKAKLMRENLGFAAFVNRCHDEISEIALTFSERAEKN